VHSPIEGFITSKGIAKIDLTIVYIDDTRAIKNKQIVAIRDDYEI